MTYVELLNWAAQQSSQVLVDNETKFTTDERLTPRDAPVSVNVLVKDQEVFIWDAFTQAYNKPLTLPKKSRRRLLRKATELRHERLIEALSKRETEFAQIVSEMSAAELIKFVKDMLALPEHVHRALNTMLSRNLALITKVTATVKKEQQ